MSNSYFGTRAEIDEIKKKRNAEIRAWGKNVLVEADRALFGGNYPEDWDFVIEDDAESDLEEPDVTLPVEEPTLPEVEPTLPVVEPTTEPEVPVVEAKETPKAAPKPSKATSKEANTAK